ncbi:MAG TPA: UV DNA damage repair endonuclease UvsE [Methanomicrobiales archaeon]|nr:UV DNA damage repair endonuclease UvsE [Methanomicrobiales archaeon]
MRIGYPCINRTIGCTANHTFRLASYGRERLEATVGENLACLGRILSFNRDHGILFFRITSDLIPFASHPVMDVAWQDRFRDSFAEIGRIVRNSGIRISMHPDPFTLLNSPDEAIVGRSIAELRYHAEVLDLMGLDATAKVQIHVGGVYHDREAAIRRFVGRAAGLDECILRRLAIENDDLRFPLADCLRIHGETGLPVILDTFHHELNHRGETLPEAVGAAAGTWSGPDGIPMVDYSSQEEGKRRGTHATTLVPENFMQFLRASRHHDLDVMLEIKDKERSTLRALEIASNDPRLVLRSPHP